jgi:O-antigen ligase
MIAVRSGHSEGLLLKKSRVPEWLATVFSFELVFVLFLFAGRFKGDPRFQWIPVDITAFFFALSVLTALYIFVSKGIRFSRLALAPIALFACFVAYTSLSLMWTPGLAYATEKALYIATLTFWPLLAGALIIAPNRRRCYRFLFLLAAFGLWIAAEAFLQYRQLNPTGGELVNVTALGGHYLGIGRVIGPAALIVFLHATTLARSRIERVLMFGIFAFLLYVLLVIGGRGPLIATVLASLIPIVGGLSLTLRGQLQMLRSLPLLLLLLAVVTAGVSYLIYAGHLSTIVYRFSVLLEHDMGVSAGNRLYYYATSLELWAERPVFGYGVGSWPLAIGFGDVRDYPHNLFLETLVEFGLVGFLLVSGFLLATLRSLGNWQTIRATPLRLLVLMLFANTFVNAMLSGDIPDNRVLFTVSGLMALRETTFNDA